MASCFLLAFCSFATAATTSHEVLTFDYGWRFHLGSTLPTPAPTPVPPTPAPNCSDPASKFPVNASEYEYLGLTNIEAAKSPTACAAACCKQANNECFMWQYSQTKGCWAGRGKKGDTLVYIQSNVSRVQSNVFVFNEGNAVPGWVGASRTGSAVPTPPPTPPAPILPENDPAAAPLFDDSQWDLLDLPHDYVVNGNYDQNTPSDQGPSRPKGGAGQSYLPRKVGFYRKHFSLPSEWQGNTIWIYFEGVFRATKMWLNGEPVREHAGFPGDAHGEGGGAGMGGGYTSFSVRLDNTTSLQYGAGSKNVLAVYVDPRMGSGWFYEGGGIYRKTYLHSAPPVHIETDGVYARSQVKSSTIVAPSTPAVGASATSASVIATATIVNADVRTRTPTTATVHFDIFDADGEPAGSGVSSTVTVNAATSKSAPSTATTAAVTIDVASAQLWSVARPYLYTLRTSVTGGDVINTSIGIYSTKWTGDQGFFLNTQHVKIRGFCNHESFGGIGMAIPDRVNLFRAQALRSVGGNGWRMSHNPVTPGLYDILDRVGVVAMDESRILGTDAISVMNMGAMVKRDRNHPSIVIWSYCNEGGCGNGGPGFRNITLKYDTSRPTLGNKAGFGQDGSTDVAGFSHSAGDVFDNYQAQNPTKPKFASECCSCSSQRSSLYGETNGDKLTDDSGALSCTASQSNASNGRPFMAGTMVWTLFDYYGESHGWPRVSSSYGQIDLAGFFKLTGFWYRTFWLSSVPESDAGRPVGFGAAHICHGWQGQSIVVGQSESVQQSESGNVYGLNVLTEAPTVKLYIDDNLTETVTVPPLQHAAFTSKVPDFGSSNVTVVCEGADEKASGSQRMLHPTNASAITLILDAPSTSTGTGSSLLLDGHDVAMLRASIVDSAGTLADSSKANITFEVVAGPGRVLATHNGDPQCHEPNNAHWHSAYVGLVRAIIQVTEHRIGTLDERKRLASIDLEHAHAIVPTTPSPAPTMITVKASSPGLGSATVEIPVSVESEHGVLPTAARSLETEQRWM